MAALKDPRLDDEVRAQAVRSLGKSGSGIEEMIELAENGEFPEELLPVAGRAVTGTMNVALRGRAAELFPVPPLKNDEPLPQMTEMLVYVGNPENGKRVYTTATCITCHQVGGEGTSFGPDLSGIGNKLSKRGLYEAILDPSSGIATGYEGTSIGLDDGTLLTAFVLGETDDKLNVKVQGGILLDLNKKDIRFRQQQKVSVMPSGLERLLTFDDLDVLQPI